MSGKSKTETTENLQFRYLYGFGILFVVLSHCDGGGFQMLSNWMNFGAFHLGIFVFGSGYFFRGGKVERPLRYFWGKVKKLLLPLWLWNLFYGLVALLMGVCGFTFAKEFSLKNLLLFPICSQDLYVLNLGSWFVFPFFMVQLLYGVGKLLLDRLGKPGITDRILQLAFLAAGAVGVCLAGRLSLEESVYPIFRILYFMPFYGAGMLYRDFAENRFLKLSPWICLGGCLLISLLLNSHFGRTVYAIPASCGYPFGVAATYLAGFTGILFWLKVSQLLAEGYRLCKPLAALGRSTWEIMIHQFAGIMAVKCFFAGCNLLFGWFGDFDRNAFLGDIWYLYRPFGVEEYAFCYVLGAFGAAFLIKWLVKKVKGALPDISRRNPG